jgi:site-specific recombinase XerD
MAPPIKEEKKFMEAYRSYRSNMIAIGRSENTVENIDNVIKLFSLFMIEDRDNWNHEVSFTDIQAWRDMLLATGRKPSTVKQYLKVLSGFYEYASSPQLGDYRFYDKNPVSKFLMPDTRQEDARPYDQILTDEQAALLWRNNSPKSSGVPEWERNYAIAVLFLSTEIRNCELLALTPADLDWENEELTVEHGKGNKYRVVDFPPIAQTAVRLYLKSGIRPSYAKDDDPLFGTCAEKVRTSRNFNAESWHAGSRQWLTELVRRHVKRVTGVDNVRSHDLRHVGARLDLNGGMPLEELQAKLGHESAEVTQIYSGKLTSRRKRRQTLLVQEEKDRQADRNKRYLEMQGDDFFSNLRPQPTVKKSRSEIA